MESIDFLERKRGAVDGKTVIVGKRDILGTAAIHLTVEKALMLTRASSIVLGSPVRTTVFLPKPSAGPVLSGLVHGQAGFT